MFYLSTGVFALYPCNNSVGRQDVLTKLEISTYTPDKEYEPIVLYIPKTCDETSPQGDNFMLLLISYLPSYLHLESCIVVSIASILTTSTCIHSHTGGCI